MILVGLNAINYGDLRLIKPVSIDIVETHGIRRLKEPVAIGVPFAEGELLNPSALKLVDESGHGLPIAMTPLSTWENGSVKWLLLNFNVDAEAKDRKSFWIESTSENDSPIWPDDPIHLEEKDDTLWVKTGEFEFLVSKMGSLSIRRICVGERDVLSKPSECIMTDGVGGIWKTRIDRFVIERNNLLTCILYFEGDFIHDDKIHGLRFKSRLHFYSGIGTSRIDFTVWNPFASKHPGGAWDLGDEGSLFIKSLDIDFHVAHDVHNGSYFLEPKDTEYSFDDRILIYQDSSGGPNWRSKNHMNRNGDVPVSFKGYEVRRGKEVLNKGDRATPGISVSGGGIRLTSTMPDFWQNFPKAWSFQDKVLSAQIFPEHFSDLYEIQGGEQKTHILFLNVENDNGNSKTASLDWVHSSLDVSIKPETYDHAGFSPGVVPYKESMSDNTYVTYQNYITHAIEGERSFFGRREIIDEYGWRHFGDLYADHEAVLYNGDDCFISHYNNQYDGVKGALFQYMRTGKTGWKRLARDMAWHVAEIDIYRTDKDRYQFNSGLFWHTDHHMDAETATHRTISIKNKKFVNPRFFGGGPSYDHNYSSGFCYYYWMTGESLFRDAALHMARYAENGIKGPDTLAEYGFVWVKNLKNKASRTKAIYPYGFNGPGRGSGNVLNTLIDAYLLTSDHKYLKHSESLIRSCVSPEDDVVSRDLLNAELRWMYTVFLQSLGRFLDIVGKINECSEIFTYARDTFLKYVQWMYENERPYLDNKENLEFPNETWAAQDIRKADILAIASCYCEKDQQEKFLKKSRYFFEKSLEHIFQYGENSYLTRPIVVMMTNGFAHMDISLKDRAGNRRKSQECSHGFGSKRKKLTRFNDVKNELIKIANIMWKTSLRKEIALIKSRLSSK